MRSEDVERILRELETRVVHEAADDRAPEQLAEVVADSAYHELRRLEDDDKAGKEERAFWHEMQARVSRSVTHPDAAVLRQSIASIVRRYGAEVAGTFDPRVYDAVTRAGEPLLALLLNAMSPKRIVQSLPSLPRLDESILLQGETEQLRRLHEVGTVILVPTHVSHMDSIAMGYALWKLGLPPFLYGAGLNLFANPLLGFFMRNLGCYTVDRRKNDPLYKRVLKEYATLTLESGFDNIFFPGGTRSRSGLLERRLKLGLVGTGLRAYVNNLLAARPGGRVYIVPATLSFQLVLEAETLVDDFLQEEGKHRYIITDDEFSQPTRVLDFVAKLFSLDSKIAFTVGRGIDPFGNLVDDEGESLDGRGRIVNPSRYVLRDGAIVHDGQRDAEFTREVGEQIVHAYERDTVLQSTHILAHATFSLLRRANPKLDVLRLVRAGGSVEELPLRDVYREIDRLLEALRKIAARAGVRLAPLVQQGSADDVAADGFRHFAIFHKRAACVRQGDRVVATNRALLFYYSNRVEAWELQRDAGLRPAIGADGRLAGAAA